MSFITMIDFTRRAKLQAALGRVFLSLAFLACWEVGVDGQNVPKYDQVYLLPSPTGDALTLTPTDLPDVSCSTVEWKDDLSKPTLAVICPPEETFAPLHLYLKLSWLRAEDVPPSIRNITVPVKTVIKIRTNKSTAWVWLGVREKPSASLRRMWVGFNALLDVALLTLSAKR